MQCKVQTKIIFFQYVRDHPAGQLFDEGDTEGIKKPDKDYHKINKETYEICYFISIQVVITAFVWESICIH